MHREYGRPWAGVPKAVFALLFALAVAVSGWSAGQAHAETLDVQDKTYGSLSLDTSKLPDGTYTVPVELKQIDNLQVASMAAPVFEDHNPATLTVQDGSYRLDLTFGGLKVGMGTYYLTALGYYPGYAYSDSELAVSGKPVSVWSDSKGGSGKAGVPASDDAKKHGYVALTFTTTFAAMGNKDAALKLDWQKLAVQSLGADKSLLERAIATAKGLSEYESSADLQSLVKQAEALVTDAYATASQVSGALDKLNAAIKEAQGQAAADKQALRQAIAKANSALSKGGKSSSATGKLRDAVKKAQAVADDADATQSAVDDQVSALKSALSSYENSTPVNKNLQGGSSSGSSASSGSAASSGKSGKSGSSGKSSKSGSGSSGSKSSSTTSSYEVGHVYSVPVTFTKAGGDDTSMAAQYFGSTALVRPQSDGTFDVRFSTNQPDYIEAISYNGTALVKTGDAEFKLVVPKTTADAVYTLSMTITPMKELGTDSVDVDLHLGFSQATDQGSESGQASDSTNTGAAASSGDGSSTGSASGAASGSTLSAQAQSDGESFEVGKVYSVPLSFTKSGSSEASMANQYFGSTALVRPQSDGTYDVRFSTNRSDYVEGIKYNGSQLSSTSEDGTSREYKMTVPSTKSDATYTLSMTITPMKELGAGDVETDMHLAYSQAKSQGADSGQVTSSTRAASGSSGASGSSAASSSGKTAAKTGDGGGGAVLFSGCAACVSLIALCAAGAALRRARRGEGARSAR